MPTESPVAIDFTKFEGHCVRYNSGFDSLGVVVNGRVYRLPVGSESGATVLKAPDDLLFSLVIRLDSYELGPDFVDSSMAVEDLFDESPMIQSLIACLRRAGVAVKQSDPVVVRIGFSKKLEEETAFVASFSLAA